MVRSSMRALLPVLVAMALASGHAEPAGDRAPRVLAHYMPWFRAETGPDGATQWEHWEWFGRGRKHNPDNILPDGRRDIASVFYPLIGPYDGRDPDVLEYHVLTARAAGIDGFVADWYGPGTYSDDVVARLLRVAETYDARLAICLEEKSFFPGYSNATSREEVLDVAEKHLRRIVDAYAPSPAYLREQGRPVVYMFINHEHGALGEHILTPDELAQLLARFPEERPFFVRGHANPAFAGVVDGAFGWVGDAPSRSNFYASALAQRATNGITYVAGAAVPGFDDHGVWGWGNGPRVIDRRGTAEYDEHWEDALLHQPDDVQVATWNDFQEGSTIEPSRDYGFTFVDRTEEWAARFKGQSAFLGDNEWPHRLYLLRRTCATIQDEETRRDVAADLDAFAKRIAEGRRFLMDYRLRRLESTVARHAPDLEGENR